MLELLCSEIKGVLIRRWWLLLIEVQDTFYVSLNLGTNYEWMKRCLEVDKLNSQGPLRMIAHRTLSFEKKIGEKITRISVAVHKWVGSVV